MSDAKILLVDDEPLIRRSMQKPSLAWDLLLSQPKTAPRVSQLLKPPIQQAPLLTWLCLISTCLDLAVSPKMGLGWNCSVACSKTT
ncbi:MAG: hypothetical protein HC806_09500 [Anaerolineae bacterium]|nr:hypothetical protein [Anaerolineae bacterium]